MKDNFESNYKVEMSDLNGKKKLNQQLLTIIIPLQVIDYSTIGYSQIFISKRLSNGGSQRSFYQC